MSDLSAPRCVTCDTPSTKSCARCKTIYCSKACQVKDWSSHKKACSNLQLELTLTRAAAVIGEAYLTFRKNTWETTIVKIEDTPDALIITDGDNWGGPQGFVKFPGDILPNNKRTQLGVLTVWACYEPFAFMETLMRKSLDGLSIDIHEVTLEFKDAIPRRTIVMHVDGREPSSNHPHSRHIVLRVKSRKSGKQWVLDFTGGQYGIVEVLHDWLEYEAAFVRTVTSVHEFGIHKRVMSGLAKIPGLTALTSGLVGNAAAALDKALLSWETSNQSVSTLVISDDTTFKEKSDSLLGVLDKAVQTFISSNNFADVVRQARADNTPWNQEMVKLTASEMLREANLLLRYPGGKPTGMDLLREKFGPNYTYREGDEFHLSPDQLLQFAEEEMENMTIVGL